KFDDLRPKLIEPPDYHDHDHGHEGHHERPSVTELTRFFRLFPHKRLALDIFSILESSRVEARILDEYRGIAAAYDRMRRHALALRPEMTLLPGREALLEFMVRLSLNQTDGLRVPSAYRKAVLEIHAMMRSIAE